MNTTEMTAKVNKHYNKLVWQRQVLVDQKNRYEANQYHLRAVFMEPAILALEKRIKAMEESHNIVK